MQIGYIGGIGKRGTLNQTVIPGWDSWHWADQDAEAFLQAGGAGCRLFDHGSIAVLIRGFVLDTWSRTPADLELLANKLVEVYRNDGMLHIDGLEGSFTLALLDAPAGRVLLYRNLVGDSHTYYHEQTRNVLFASNLADLLRLAGATLEPNNEELPTYFLNRNVPGRNTLFKGFHRVLPGEQLQRKSQTVQLMQRRTLGDLREATPIGREAPERLESLIGQIFRDYHAQEPEMANLLSGGVDSSFLQVHWNRVRSQGAPPPQSFCVAVSHPRTQGDLDYAKSASALLGTNHRIVLADGAYRDYLLDTMTETAEMPSHVQLAYYLTLGREMAKSGGTSALLGEGADSLFGLSVATALQSAALLRKIFPMRMLRRGGAKVADWLHWPRVRGYFDLADYLHDYERLEHPVNRVAVYADWQAVETCFGKQAIAEVAASRRALLEEHHVPKSPLERVHYAGVLGSSINISALVTTVFARCGVRTFSPFYDSRMLRFAANLSPSQRFRFRQPKALLKGSLARHGFSELAYRSKKSFGQPIFEWLAPGGQLAEDVSQIDSYPFVDTSSLEATKAKPTWFLYSLLCYDLWHKRFIRRVSEPLAA